MATTQHGPRASIPLRLPAQLKRRAEYAASLRGESLNGFIASALAEASERVIESEKVVRLTEEGARRLDKLLAEPPAVSAKLLRAAAEHERPSRQ